MPFRRCSREQQLRRSGGEAACSTATFRGHCRTRSRTVPRRDGVETRLDEYVYAVRSGCAEAIYRRSVPRICAAPLPALRGQSLRTIESAPHDVERRPRRTLAQGAEEFSPCSSTVRELVVSIPAPRCDHRKNEDPALAEQFLISVRIVLADLFGHMGEVELDRPAATRLEVYEQQPVLRAEHVAWVRLAVQQLLGGAAVADRSPQASQRVAEKLPVRVSERRSVVAARRPAVEPPRLDP